MSEKTKREEIAREFDERIAPNFRGFDAAYMDTIKEAYISNELDNYSSWYRWHVALFGEIMPEYGPEYLTRIYLEQIEDGDTPKESFLSVVLCALERDL